MPRRDARTIRKRQQTALQQGGGDALAQALSQALAESQRPETSSPSRALASRAAQPTPAAKARAPESPYANEALLFQSAVGKVTPIREQHRAPLARPRPAPLPLAELHTLHPARAAAAGTFAAPESSAPPHPPSRQGALAARSDQEYFLHEMADVQPLAGRNTAQLRDPRPSPAPPELLTQQPSLSPLDPRRSLDDAALFRLAVRGTQEIHPPQRSEIARPLPAPLPRQSEQDERAVLDEALRGSLSLEDRLDGGEETTFLRPGLPRRVLSDLRRGRWAIQGQIDLHGYTRESAREALITFLAFSLREGHRCVRVIHGKGLGSPGKISILRQLARHWLAQREEIFAFCQAAPHDGGSGVLLVLLGVRRS